MSATEYYTLFYLKALCAAIWVLNALTYLDII